MNLVDLKAELDAGHPDTGAYNADDALAADELNAINRTRDRTSLTGSQILNAVDQTQWAGLDAAEKQTVWDIVHLGTINPFGVEATLLIGVFGAGTATIIALAAARVEEISRSVELAFGTVLTGDVQRARSL